MRSALGWIRLAHQECSLLNREGPVLVEVM